MPKKKVYGDPLAIRFTKRVLAAITQVAKEINEATPAGVTINRSDAVRVLVEEALATRGIKC